MTLWDIPKLAELEEDGKLNAESLKEYYKSEDAANAVLLRQEGNFEDSDKLFEKAFLAGFGEENTPEYFAYKAEVANLALQSIELYDKGTEKYYEKYNEWDCAENKICEDALDFFSDKKEYQNAIEFTKRLLEKDKMWKETLDNLYDFMMKKLISDFKFEEAADVCKKTNKKLADQIYLRAILYKLYEGDEMEARNIADTHLPSIIKTKNVTGEVYPTDMMGIIMKNIENESTEMKKTAIFELVRYGFDRYASDISKKYGLESHLEYALTSRDITNQNIRHRGLNPPYLHPYYRNPSL